MASAKTTMAAAAERLDANMAVELEEFVGVRGSVTGAGTGAGTPGSACIGDGCSVVGMGVDMGSGTEVEGAIVVGAIVVGDGVAMVSGRSPIKNVLSTAPVRTRS